MLSPEVLKCLGVALAAMVAVAAPMAQGPALPAADRAAIDAIFADYDKPASPGCMLGVVAHGALVYARGYGRASIEHDVAFTSQTVFDIGSTSKQFLATAVLLLVEDGKLSLDDDVRKYIPELPDYGETITIRHLLTHTSGLRDYITLITLGGWQMPVIRCCWSGRMPGRRRRRTSIATPARSTATNCRRAGSWHAKGRTWSCGTFAHRLACWRRRFATSSRQAAWWSASSPRKGRPAASPSAPAGRAGCDSVA